MHNPINKAVARPAPKPASTALFAVVLLLSGLGSARAVAGIETVLLAQGDSLTHGTMDARNTGFNTENAYLQKVADALAEVIDIRFTQPLFTDNGDRAEPFRIPTNLAVDGADAFTLEGLEYYKRAGVEESYVSETYLCDQTLPRRFEDNTDRVLYPINLLAGKDVAQIDAAEWWLNRIGADPNLRGIKILWIGNNESASSALGQGGLNPTFLPIPFEAIASELSPVLRLLMKASEAQGILSFEPYTQVNVERNLTDLEDFDAQYNHLLDRLEAPVGQLAPDLDLFLVTLPYYGSVGYLLDADDLEYYLGKLDPNYRVPASFQRPRDSRSGAAVNGDRISLLTFGMMYGLLATGHGVEEVNEILEQGGAQNDGMVLSEEEQQIIVARIDAYNQVIEDAAAARGPRVHPIRIGQRLKEAMLNGVEIGGYRFDRRWGRGNGFSLDGVHPGYTGHGFIANEMLNAINDALGIAAPLLDLNAIPAMDPYVDKDGDGWVPGPDTPASGIPALLFLFTDPDDADDTVGVTLPDDVWEQISDALLKSLVGIERVRPEAQRLGILESP